MKSKIKLTTYLIFFLVGSLSAQQADDIIGEYHLPNELDVKIYKNNGKYYGKIIALNGYEQTKDFKNPDKSKRKDLLIGKVIIKGLEFDKEDKRWINGSMYGPEKGMLFNLKVTEINNKEIKVVGSKYLFWRTLTWLKI